MQRSFPVGNYARDGTETPAEHLFFAAGFRMLNFFFSWMRQLATPVNTNKTTKFDLSARYTMVHFYYFIQIFARARMLFAHARICYYIHLGLETSS